ncbi:MAG: hypothetical protein A2W77_07240 [Nitrospinae bacterium RIFCSPLOWO2_12_39_16]|nr:MAG: hypothetical protein A2W77_07240 [Nitrospinae bacterium RIFCSPLOWO2_12_39_16]
MIQREIIENKLRLLLGYLSELKDFLEITYEDYLSSNKNKRTIERLIELIVECGSDISGDILSLLNGTAPESYYKSFSLLGEKGVFEKDFAVGLAKYGGLRNRIAHEYGSYKDEIVYSQIKPLYKDFQRFYKAVTIYLKSLKDE